MDQELFTAADHYLDEISDALDQTLLSSELRKLRDAIKALGKALGARYAVELTCLVEVVDNERERHLPLLNVGLSSSGGEEPHRVTGDSSPQRYLVDGNIQVVPHDHCPKCWGIWDFKWEHRSCSHCDAVLGKTCKLLLDSDVCPHCDTGKVTATLPKCSQCGFEVDLSCVAWG